MLSLIYFILVLGVLIMVHELGHMAAARSVGVKVERFSFGFGPKIFSFKKGDTEYLISLIPLGGYVKMAGDDPSDVSGKPWEYMSKSVAERARIIAAGPLLNYLLAFLVFSFVFMFGSPTLTTEVGTLLKDYPAEKAGLMAGDVVTAVDGKRAGDWEEMTGLIRKRVEGALVLSIERGGEPQDVTVTPSVRQTRDIFGNDVKTAMIGIGPSEKITKVRYGVIESFGMGAKKLAQLTLITYKALWSIIVGRVSMKESMTGPIGIFMITGKAAQLGFIYIFHLMGVLSASLAIFNLLPFPVLDGGHMIFLGLEKLRGKPLSVKAQETIANIGVTALILLTVFIFYNDMMKFGVFSKIGGLFKK